MKDIRIGVVGIGRLGHQHAVNVQRSVGGKLIAISDPSESINKSRKCFWCINLYFAC